MTLPLPSCQEVKSSGIGNISYMIHSHTHNIKTRETSPPIFYSPASRAITLAEWILDKHDSNLKVNDTAGSLFFLRDAAAMPLAL